MPRSQQEIIKCIMNHQHVNLLEMLHNCESFPQELKLRGQVMYLCTSSRGASFLCALLVKSMSWRESLWLLFKEVLRSPEAARTLCRSTYGCHVAISIIHHSPNTWKCLLAFGVLKNPLAHEEHSLLSVAVAFLRYGEWDHKLAVLRNVLETPFTYDSPFVALFHHYCDDALQFLSLHYQVHLPRPHQSRAQPSPEENETDEEIFFPR